MFPRDLLMTPILSLSFLTDRRKDILTQLSCLTVWETLMYHPMRYEDRTRVGKITNQCGEKSTSAVKILNHGYFPFRGKSTLQITVGDDSMQAYLLCFGRNFLAKYLPVGSSVLLYTHFVKSRGRWVSSQFEYTQEANASDFLTIKPVYLLRKGIQQKSLHLLMQKILIKFLPSLEDDIDTKWLLECLGADELAYFSTTKQIYAQVLRAIHQPNSIETVPIAKKILAFRNLIGIHTRYSLYAANNYHPLPEPLELKNEIFQNIPFTLTDSQHTALTESIAHLQNNRTGRHLIQGDVGCGKTIVALIIAILLAKLGHKTIFLAPTYLLAIQHAQKNKKLIESYNLSSDIMHSGLTQKTLDTVRKNFSDGSIDILFGTHKLIYESMPQSKFTLLIIDEQQRFGVEQRKALLSTQSPPPFVLMLSATPIPRSVAHIISGYVSVSTIQEKPVYQKPVKTHLSSQKNIEQAYRLIENELKKGNQAYIVFPRIHEAKNLRSIESMLQTIEKRFNPYACGMVHSKMDSKDIVSEMTLFSEGKTKVLLASSIIEVGIDVKTATVLLVEHAELFGLSTLHQLRGRVGRGTLQSYCCYSFSEELSENAKQRLKILYETNDGFTIAEQDLLLRGPGDLAGTNQSGHTAQSFQLALKYPEILEASKKIAIHLLTDPETLHRMDMTETPRELEGGIL